MINFGKLHLTEGMDPIEQSASDKAVESGQKKRDPSKTTRQKSMMSQPTGARQKSNIVYANEEMRQIDLVKAYNRERSSWRDEINEEKEQDPNHPYVDLMPMTNGAEERAKKQMKLAKKVGVEHANKIAGMAEDFDFITALGKMIDESADNPFQMHFDKDGKPYKTSGTKEERDRVAKNRAANRKNNVGQFDHSKRND
jgi:hypothetical protein